MKSRLIVKNFGPIKHVDLDLRNVNVFIGPQASGKSALAKLFTIFKTPRKFLNEVNGEVKTDPVKAFNEILEDYNIASFLKSNTEINFDSDIHALRYNNNNIDYIPELKNEINEISRSFDEFKKSNFLDYIVKEKIRQLQERYHLISPRWFDININDTDENKSNQFQKVINSAIESENYLSTEAAIYISAERTFINVIKNYSLNLLLNKVPIPKHILLLGAEIEKSNGLEIDLSFLGESLFYKTVNGEAKIFISESDSINLIEAASGIQSAVNVLIPVLMQSKSRFHRSFVIEEPELNLFPIAQYELIKKLESLRKESYYNDEGAIHTYTTHSPYILSSFNNLLYASKIWNKFGIASAEHIPGIEEKLKDIIPFLANIQPGIFSAYQINEGYAKPIFDRETGLINDNYIDESSDKMADDFDALMELMK